MYYQKVSLDDIEIFQSYIAGMVKPEPGAVAVNFRGAGARNIFWSKPEQGFINQLRTPTLLKSKFLEVDNKKWKTKIFLKNR